MNLGADVAAGQGIVSLKTKERNGPRIAPLFWLGSPRRVIVMHQTTGATRRKLPRTALISTCPTEFGHHGTNHYLAWGWPMADSRASSDDIEASAPFMSPEWSATMRAEITFLRSRSWPALHPG